MEGVGSISKHRSWGFAPGEHSTKFARSVARVDVGRLCHAIANAGWDGSVVMTASTASSASSAVACTASSDAASTTLSAVNAIFFNLWIIV